MQEKIVGNAAINYRESCNKCTYIYILVCMHACMFVCMQVCMFVCMYLVCMPLYVCMHVCIHMCMYVYECMHVCVYVFMYVLIFNKALHNFPQAVVGIVRTTLSENVGIWWWNIIKISSIFDYCSNRGGLKAILLKQMKN